MIFANSFLCLLHFLVILAMKGARRQNFLNYVKRLENSATNKWFDVAPGHLR